MQPDLYSSAVQPDPGAKARKFTVAALLVSLEGRRIVSAAVASLFKVAEAQRRMSLGSLRPSDVILEVGVSPAVRVRYREPGQGTLA